MMAESLDVWEIINLQFIEWGVNLINKLLQYGDLQV